MENILKKIEKQVKEEFGKEYACHLKIVQKIAIDLQKKFGGDLDIIKLVAVAHDIGRVQDGDNELHAERGSLRIKEWLKDEDIAVDTINKISRCVLMHNKTKGFKSLEGEIIRNADLLSKVVGHQEFMLMCKKDNYIDKAKWGLKHIEKGYTNLTIPTLKNEYKTVYEKIKRKYEDILEI